MPAIVLPYAITDGNVLSPLNYNSNIYDTTGSNGIMSGSNGGLDENNLAGGFQLARDMVQTEEAVRHRQEHMIESLDYLSEAFPSDDDGQPGASYTPIPGCSLVFHIPFIATAVIWQWTLFWSACKWHAEIGASGINWAVNLRARLDGSPLGATTRGMPNTARAVPGAGGGVTMYENRSTGMIDGCRLTQNVAAGWHQLSYEINFEPLIDAAGTDWVSPSLERTVNNFTLGLLNYYLHNRVSCGIRNARALVFR